MTYLLGIDGGGSGCRAAIAAPDGRVLGRGATGPANLATDPDGALRNILAAARLALQDSGLGLGMAELQAGLGLAGANSDGAVERLSGALPFSRFRVVTDGETAARGALGPRDGILATLGTGSVFVVRSGGRLRQVGGWGFVLGDEGSGARLGRALLVQALRAYDGLCRQTPLLEQVMAELGGPARVVAFSLSATPADFAAFAPRLITSQDAAARAIVDESVADVAEILALLQAAGILPVVFTGGLGPFYQSRLADRWPTRPAEGTALDGALLLAREAA